MNIYSIYKATNIKNGKSYIGFDSHWPKRKSEHKSAAIRDTNYNKFYNAIKKYGWESFAWEIIYQSTDGHHCLHTMESYFITEYNSLADGYNSTRGGESGLGNKWWNNGKVQVFTEYPPNETFIRGRLKFNNTGAKIGSDIQRGKHWVNNGVDEMMVLKEELPIGYAKGRLPSKAFNGNQGKHTIGTRWWNNGTISSMKKECPGPQWTRGRL
jgi:group I intron endonuclease